METIGFDLDGVIYNIHPVAYTELVANWGLSVSEYNFWSNYKSFYTENFYAQFFQLPFLYCRSVPSRDVRETLDYIATKYRLCYITSRNEHALRFVTESWMKKYDLPYRTNLEFSKNKSIEIRMYDCSYFVEDQWVQWKIDKINKITNLILVDAIYNKHIINVPRIRSIKELQTLL